MRHGCNIQDLVAEDNHRLKSAENKLGLSDAHLGNCAEYGNVWSVWEASVSRNYGSTGGFAASLSLLVFLLLLELLNIKLLVFFSLQFISPGLAFLSWPFQ